MSEGEKKTAFYVPQGESKQPPAINKTFTSYPSKLPDVIKVRLKDSAVAHQIAVGLYKNPLAGSRELYSNETRAARTARTQYNANPKIKITLNAKERTLTITGIDSLGITSSVFLDALRYMGRTTNNDENTVGQFGWGFFAAFALSDELRLETYARETEERYGVTATSASGFKPLPENEVQIEDYGTMVRLKLKQDIELAQLVDWMEWHCRYSDVETVLNILEPILPSEKARWSSWIHRNEKLRQPGQYKLNGTVREQLSRKATFNYPNLKAIYETEIDRPDYYFYGILIGDDDCACDETREGDLLLLQVPIESDETKSDDSALFKHTFTYWTLNIKNERCYAPTPDRDRFVKDALKPIIDDLQEIVKNKLSNDFCITNFKEYRRSLWKGVYADPNASFWTHKHFANVGVDTIRVVGLLSVPCIAPGLLESVERAYVNYRWSIVRNHKNVSDCDIGPLRKLVARSEHLFLVQQQKRKDAKHVIPLQRMRVLRAILRSKYPDAEVFTYVPPDQNSNYGYDAEKISQYLAAALTSFKREGVVQAEQEADKIRQQLGKDWRALCGLAPISKNKNKHLTDWAIHDRTKENYGRLKPRRVSAKQIPQRVIRVPGNLGPYLKTLDLVKTDYGVTKNHDALKGGTLLTDLVNTIKDKTVPTKTGTITFAVLAKTTQPLTVYLTNNPDIIEHYDPPEGGLLVATNNSEAFELMIFLTANKKAFTPIKHPDSCNFEEKTGLTLKTITEDNSSDDDSERATIAFIGASRIHTPEIRLLLLHAIKQTYSSEEAETHLKQALELDTKQRTIHNTIKQQKKHPKN